MTSRIEQIISEIEEYIDGCKFQPLSNSKIIVNKEELEELLTELRMKTPDEITQSRKGKLYDKSTRKFLDGTNVREAYSPRAGRVIY